MLQTPTRAAEQAQPHAGEWVPGERLKHVALKLHHAIERMEGAISSRQGQLMGATSEAEALMEENRLLKQSNMALAAENEQLIEAVRLHQARSDELSGQLDAVSERLDNAIARLTEVLES